ncbi:DUF2185 domain-containing protein [Frondihabitans sp. 4ASC-45]|uniref:immunity protein Imm33 domain-containing protein n=1 Tax=Frondihabitans sp. 4ASC-45 TaxID=3111636 RepID=UPI003C170A91
MTTEFIRHAGDSLASTRILDGSSPLGWAFREAPVAPEDNGWRFLSQDDNETFINTPGNIRVADFNAVAEIEPAVIAIYGFPVGTDLTFVIEPSGARKFVDSTTREEVALPYLP